MRAAITRTVPAPADLGLELIGVPQGAELDLRLRMESVSEGVLVSGTVTGPLAGECGRCLRPISDTLDRPRLSTIRSASPRRSRTVSYQPRGTSSRLITACGAIGAPSRAVA